MTVYGEPCTGNYRIITRRTKTGQTFASMAMTPEARKWRKRAKQELDALPPRPVLTGPVELEIVAFLGRPGRILWKTKPMPSEWALKKPDNTNVQKLVEDALIGHWIEDDCQVVRATTTKMYAPGKGYGDPRPRVEITLRALEAQPERPAEQAAISFGQGEG